MSNVKISNLTSATTPLAGTEVLPIVQSSTTKQVSVADLTVGRAVTLSSLTVSGGTANGIAYLNGSKVVTTGAAITFNGTNFATTGSATAASFIPSSSAIPTNGMYLTAANTLAFSTNSAFVYSIDSSQRIHVGNGSTLGKLGVHGDSVNFSPSADNSSNGIGCCILGNNVATATASAGKLFMSGGNAAHAGCVALYSGSVITSTITMTNVGGTVQTNIDGNGNATLVGVYSATVGATNRDLYVDNTGKLGYVSSTRESKTNIQNINDVSWLANLQPVTFNRKKKHDIFSDDEYKVKVGEQYTDETYDELEYGLIADDVESINSELCFYDTINGNKKLAGVHYSKLVVPLLKMVQDQQVQIDLLKSTLAKLESAK